MTVVCALCGFEYEPGGAACASRGCPLSFGACRLEHCPECGYTVPSVESGAVGWLFGAFGRPRAAPAGPLRRLTDLPAGGEGVVARVSGPVELTDQLTLLGVTPGSRVRLCQRAPSYVVQVDGSELAFERSVAETVWVHR